MVWGTKRLIEHTARICPDFNKANEVSHERSGHRHQQLKVCDMRYERAEISWRTDWRSQVEQVKQVEWRTNLFCGPRSTIWSQHSHFGTLDLRSPLLTAQSHTHQGPLPSIYNILQVEYLKQTTFTIWFTIHGEFFSILLFCANECMLSARELPHFLH